MITAEQQLTYERQHNHDWAYEAQAELEAVREAKAEQIVDGLIFKAHTDEQEELIAASVDFYFEHHPEEITKSLEDDKVRAEEVRAESFMENQ